jgi:hypothetical protein
MDETPQHFLLDHIPHGRVLTTFEAARSHHELHMISRSALTPTTSLLTGASNSGWSIGFVTMMDNIGGS